MIRIQSVLGQKKMTSDGEKRKKAIVEKLFFCRKKTRLIIHFYSAVFQMLKEYVCYVPLCPPFRYVRKQILSFRCVRMRTKRNDWYVPLCPLFRYVRDGFSSFRCVRVRTKRNDWYVPLCPPFRYVRKQILSFRCVRIIIK